MAPRDNASATSWMREEVRKALIFDRKHGKGGWLKLLQGVLGPVNFEIRTKHGSLTMTEWQNMRPELKERYKSALATIAVVWPKLNGNKKAQSCGNVTRGLNELLFVLDEMRVPLPPDWHTGLALPPPPPPAGAKPKQAPPPKRRFGRRAAASEAARDWQPAADGAACSAACWEGGVDHSVCYQVLERVDREVAEGSAAIRRVVAEATLLFRSECFKAVDTIMRPAKRSRPDAGWPPEEVPGSEPSWHPGASWH